MSAASSKTALQLLGETLRTPTGGAQAIGSDVDVIGLYFSAHWCPPCRGFTPQLAKKYAALRDAGKRLEIVFVSSDQGATQFEEYHGEQPWLALPFEKRDEKAALSKLFGVSGIPTLVFLDAKTGQTITTEGRAGVSAPTFVADFPYHPKPVNDLAASTSGINDKASLVVLMESAGADQQAKVGQALTELAEEEFKQDEAVRKVQRFFTGTGGGPLPQVRKLLGLPTVVAKHAHAVAKQDGGEAGGWGCDGCGSSGRGKERFRCTDGCDFDFCGACKEASEKDGGAGEAAAPVMAILDLGDEGAFYLPAEGKRTVTAENLAAFVDDFAAKKLTKQQAKRG